MTEEQFENMLDTYGANPQHWPDEIRTEAEALLNRSDHCRQLLAPHRALDNLLDSYKARTPSSLHHRILENLPLSLSERILRWLIPGVPTDLWHPIAAACLPLVFGVIVGASTPDNWAFEDEAALSWEQEEIYLLAVGDLTPPINPRDTESLP